MVELNRKGISSVVVERAESLRAEGIGLATNTNGWRALDELGVGNKLRPKAIPLTAVREVFMDRGVTRESPAGKDELRCLLRSDIVQELHDELPPGTVHFSCRIVGIKTDPATSNHTLHFNDGSVATAKVLIGCDGINSIVAEALGIKAVKKYHVCATRGLTFYPDGHGFDPEFLRTKKGKVLSGRLPVNDKLVYWFVARPRLVSDDGIWGKPELIKQATLEALKEFPPQIYEMVKSSDMDSFIFTNIRYREPLDILQENFCRGTMTVAGDAMHPMGPFLGQGAAAALEDAVVLARCLAKVKETPSIINERKWQVADRVGMALDDYVKERKMRLLRLAIQTYLTGKLVDATLFMGVLLAIFIKIVFGGSFGHTKYDCGRL
ncbi:hypothetical protein ACLOJK_014135 [Asimina triloba]